MSIKISKLEIENVKRVKAVSFKPTKGLTVIGGKNGQGKTSVLDAIAWALGGNKYKPSQATREGSIIPPNLKVTLSNGLVVERKGKNSELKVIDPAGNKGGQQLLNSFVEELAINLPKFMNLNSTEKSKYLLQIIGVGEELARLEQEETKLYNERRYIGQVADQKSKYAEELTYYNDTPKELVSPTALIQQQQEILFRNEENKRKRFRVVEYEKQKDYLHSEVERMKQTLEAIEKQYAQACSDLETAQKDILALVDESTEELEQNLLEIEGINLKVRANLDKEKAEDDARQHNEQYADYTSKIEAVRKQKVDLLANSDMPLEGLSVEEGELIYKGQKWDNMSGAEQLKVATAIVRKLKSDCGFVLLDKLEQMDIGSLNEFGSWLEQEGLQAIATRVSTGDECSIIIEDGYVVGATQIEEPKKWEAGVF